MPQQEEAPSETPASQRLTNDDFRKLLMTPRATPSAAPSSHAPGSIREAMAKGEAMPPPKSEDRHELRRKRKSFYAKLKKQEDDKIAELAEKYRDRARERRDGQNPDYQGDDPLNTASAYRAVAPDVKSGIDAAERRRQMIQESKFLGGDMEHTHLVKGLDYALLQKVRSEIQVKENEQEQELERLASKPLEAEKPDPKLEKKEEEELSFKTKLGRSIHRTICQLKSRHIERSELFVPGRMAYVVDLDEDADTDIPTTLIRSKAEVPSLNSTPTLTTNDIVINKLAQILSYLRQGARRGRKGKKGMEKRDLDMDADLGIVASGSGNLSGSAGGKRNSKDDSIYGELGDYIPGSKSQSGSLQKRQSYFDKMDDDSDLKAPDPPQLPSISGTRSHQLLNRLAQEPEGYAECYPGLDEMQDAIDDSDDEVDYSKMDLGNKKGPIGRWDFDTAEEYSEYMNAKEALPKAAFQYGVKMADGRRSRKHKDKNEKAELDREWQKIQNIIQKRKGPKLDDGDYKVARY